MTKDTWLDLGPLTDFPEDRPVLRKAGGQRFACVRAGDSVHAIDDRCPHQGYPLSQGTCASGVLTCEWHNWKFDLSSGECTFGGEAVRRYPTRVEDGRVHLSPAIDVEREAGRLRAGLAQALVRDEMGRALRESLRLGQLAPHPRNTTLGPLAAAFELTAQDGARRAEYGFDHGLAVLADLVAWAERGWLPKEEAFVTAAHAVAEPSLHLPARKLPLAALEALTATTPSPRAAGVTSDPDPGGAAVTSAAIAATAATAATVATATPDALDPARIPEALAAERRDEAEARVRLLAREEGGAAAAAALVPFLARHLFDYGHSVIFTAKAAEIAARFPSIAEDVFGALATSLAWATAETALPPFTTTRAALDHLETTTLPRGELALLERADRASYEGAVLESEAAATAATLDLIARGFDPRSLLRAIAHAAAERVARFDIAWETRTDAEVGALDVTHTLTFAESALALLDLVDTRERAGSSAPSGPREAARLAVLAAAFVGKVRRGDRADLADPAPHTNAPDLEAAIAARDAGRAIAIAREMTTAERRAAYAQLAPFAALDAATRPIFYAHTVKNTEACHRLDRDDPFADATYLRALLAFIVPPRPERRARRVARVATTFLADGRPPEGLY